MRNYKTIKWLMVITLLSSVLWLLGLTGCINNNVNLSPVLVDVVEDISIVQGDSLTIGLEYVNGYDEDGDKLFTILQDGDNYSLIGNIVVPDSGFIGDIHIPVQLSDNNSKSNTEIITISVVKTLLVLPIYTGSWWSYNDSSIAEDTVLTSRLEVADSIVTISIDSLTSKSAHILLWSNLEEYGLNYFVGNEGDGSYQYGVASPRDTIIKNQLQYMFPCSLNTTWPFTLIMYNVSDDILYEDTTISIVCTDTSAYITVPAGTFRCIEYTYVYNTPLNRGANNDIIVNTPLGLNSRAVAGTITEKVYYSNGVGYVQKIKMNGNEVIWKKVLTDYYVEDTGI